MVRSRSRNNASIEYQSDDHMSQFTLQVDKTKASEPPVKKTLTRKDTNASFLALNNPLILENILRYVSSKDTTKINRSAMISVRLVSKTWLRATSRVLKKFQCYAIQIILDRENKVNGKVSKLKTKAFLEHFITTFNRKRCSKDSFLSYSLNISIGFDWKRDLKSLQNCLKLCGDTLVSVDLALPQNIGSGSLKRGILNFPVLRRLKLDLYSDSDNRSKALNSSETGLNFLQTILNAAVNLKIFAFLHRCADSVFGRFESIKLPATVTTIASYTSPFEVFHQLIINNNLPGLQDITLIQTSSTDDVSGLLNLCRSTLKTLRIFSNPDIEEPNRRMLINFPLMENLENITIQGKVFRRDPKSKWPLSKQVPKLKDFSISGTTEAEYFGWLKNSRFEYVNELTVLLCDESTESNILSPSSNTIQKIRETFPNFSSVSFNLDFGNLSVLQTLFRDWKHLQQLELSFHGNLRVGNAPYVLLSNLLAIPVDDVKELEKKYNSTVIEGSIEPDLKPSNISTDSILSLKQLKYLALNSMDDETDFTKGTFNNCLDMFLRLLICSGMKNMKKTELSEGFEITRKDDSEEQHV